VVFFLSNEVFVFYELREALGGNEPSRLEYDLNRQIMGAMTTSHLILMTSLYLAVFVGVAYLTRARVPRIAGAICGGAVFGVVALLAVALGEAQGWWRAPKIGSLYFRSLLWLGVAVSCTPIYLITWRVARRFGGRGLAMFALAAAVVGPPRDYLVAAMFPGWIIFSPGIAPVLAVATFYALLVVVGHAVMRMVSGPAQGDSFSRAALG
jgi:hypothetical protein